MKDLLENLRNKEVKYFRWYLRTADESKDGFKPIRRCRLKYADRLDILDLLLQMYPEKVKLVTEKILQKISSNKAQVNISISIGTVQSSLTNSLPKNRTNCYSAMAYSTGFWIFSKIWATKS